MIDNFLYVWYDSFDKLIEKSDFENKYLKFIRGFKRKYGIMKGKCNYCRTFLGNGNRQYLCAETPEKCKLLYRHQSDYQSL